MNLTTIKTAGMKALRTAGLMLHKVKPELLTYGGIGLGAACVVVACVKTTKLEGVVDNAKEKLDAVKEKHEDGSPEQKKEITAVYVHTAGEIAKLYALPAALGGLSVAFTIGGHNVLRKENAAITAAYMALGESLRQYRDRVIADQGEDKDLEYMHGIKAEEKEFVDEEGNVEKKKMYVREAGSVSVYARPFDESNTNWDPNPHQNLLFLRGMETRATNMLHANGFLFLNEVYDLLGMPRTEAGQYVGWVDGMGDGFVDFGLNNMGDSLIRSFLLGDEPAVLVDFNVDGPIMYIFEHLHQNEEHDKLKALNGRIRK